MPTVSRTGPATGSTTGVGRPRAGGGGGGSMSGLDSLTTIFEEFDKRMETKIKKTPRIPTAEEFLADFENSFHTKLASFSGGYSGLGPNELDFARNVMMPAIFSQYQSELGKIAQTGQSPFITKPGGSGYQTSDSTGTSTTNRSQSTSGSGSEDSSAGTKATENFSISENTEIAEDILIPKIMPMEILDKLLTPGAIRIGYEGSRRGAGSFQSAGTGTVSARRV